MAPRRRVLFRFAFFFLGQTRLPPNSGNNPNFNFLGVREVRRVSGLPALQLAAVSFPPGASRAARQIREGGGLDHTGGRAWPAAATVSGRMACQTRWKPVDSRSG
jgi:hypothetical protein